VADERPALSPDEELAALRKEFDDFRSTMAARVSTRPTGDIEQTIRSTAKAGALLMQGQTVSRTTYPVLWQWAQDQGLVITNLFGSGDGSTTFVLPDFRGRVTIGVGTLGSDTYALGNAGGGAFVSLSISNMPSHDHSINGSTGSTGGHTHGFGTSTNGGHSGHTNAPSSVSVATGGAGSTNFPSFYNNFFGDHSHSGGTDNQGNHSHGVTLDVLPNGSGNAFDNRQPYIALNWMIYT
jgi:microcystin-dependent protein